MPSYAEQMESSADTIISKQMGSAENISVLEGYYNDIRDNYGQYAGIVLLLFVFGVVGTLYFPIEESIRVTEDRKPKLYFYFWSTILTVFGGFLYVVQMTTLLDNIALFTAAICLIIVSLLFPVVIVSVDIRASRNTGKIVVTKLFTSPFAALVPTILCKFVWQCFTTAFGLYFFGILLCYLIYITPNMVLVYYFYPLRTLIRALYVIGAAFYTVVLGAFLLYQFERAIETLKLYCYTLIHRCARWNRTSSQPFTTRTELDEKYHKNYYLKEFKDAVRKYGGVCAVLMIPLNILKFVLALLVLVVYIHAELILGELLFEKTTTVEANINSLLAILPTMLLFIATWLGREFFFDLTTDSRELDMPSLRRKATMQETPTEVMVTTPACVNQSKEEEENTGSNGSGVLDYTNFCFWLTREMAWKQRGDSEPCRKCAEKIGRIDRVNKKEYDEIRSKSATNADGKVGDTSSAVLHVPVDETGASAVNESDTVSVDILVDSADSGSYGRSMKKKLSYFSGLGNLCLGACPGAKQADSDGEEGMWTRLHQRKTAPVPRGTYGALDRVEILSTGIGVAEGIGGVASGVGSIVGAVGEGSDGLGEVHTIAGGISKSFGGLGLIFKGLNSASKGVSKSKQSSKSNSKEEEKGKEETDDKTSEGGLGEGLEAMGDVAKGIGGVADGVGDMTSDPGGVASTVGGIAGGIGKSLGGFGGIAKGLSSVNKGFGFGSTPNKSPKSMEAVGYVAKGIGGVADGVGGVTSGVGNVASAVGISGHATSMFSGVVGGIGKSLGGFGGIAISLSSANKGFGSRPNKSPKSTKAVGYVAKGIGGVADGVGGVTSGVGNVASAVGVSGDVTRKVSGAAGKGIRLGRETKITENSEAPARSKGEDKSEEGDDEGTTARSKGEDKSEEGDDEGTNARSKGEDKSEEGDDEGTNARSKGEDKSEEGDDEGTNARSKGEDKSEEGDDEGTTARSKEEDKSEEGDDEGTTARSKEEDKSEEGDDEGTNARSKGEDKSEEGDDEGTTARSKEEDKSEEGDDKGTNARSKGEDKSEEGDDEGTKEGEGIGRSGSNNEVTPLLEKDAPQN